MGFVCVVYGKWCVATGVWLSPVVIYFIPIYIYYFCTPQVFKKIGLSGMKKLSPQLTGDEGSTTTFMLGRLGGDAADIVGDDAAIPPSQDIAQAMESALGNVDNDEEPVHSGRNRGDDGSASPPPLAQTHKTVSFSDLCPSATSVDTAAATVVEKANVFPEPRNDPVSEHVVCCLYVAQLRMVAGV